MRAVRKKKRKYLSERVTQLNLISLSQKLRDDFTRMTKYSWKKKIPGTDRLFNLGEKCPLRLNAWK